MNKVITVLKKEVIDIFRDKKTIVFMLILSALIYPIMFKVMGYTMNISEKSAEKEIKIVVEGDTDSEVIKFLKDQNNIKFENNINNPEESLKNGDIQLVLNIPEGIDRDIEKDKQISIKMLVDNESNISTIAASMVREKLNKYSNSIVNQKLRDRGIDLGIITPITVDEKSGISESNNNINNITTILMGMLPAILVIMILTPTIGIASDLGAGEKERGTLEPLLATSVNKDSILFGKILSISSISLCAFMISIISLTISFKDFISSIGGEEVELKINGVSIILMILVALLMIITLASMQISVSIFSRSIKEANTYLSGIVMPMMLVAFIPVYMDIKSVSIILFNIPVMNVVLIMKEFLFGIYNFTHIVVVLFWHIIYICIAIVMARSLFSREDVIFRN